MLLLCELHMPGVFFLLVILISIVFTTEFLFAYYVIL